MLSTLPWGATSPSISRIQRHSTYRMKSTLRDTTVGTDEKWRRVLYAEHAPQLRANSIDDIRPTTCSPSFHCLPAFFLLHNSRRRRLYPADSIGWLRTTSVIHRQCHDQRAYRPFSNKFRDGKLFLKIVCKFVKAVQYSFYALYDKKCPAPD